MRQRALSFVALLLVACSAADTSSGVPTLAVDEDPVVLHEQDAASMSRYAVVFEAETSALGSAPDSAEWLAAVDRAAYLVWGDRAAEERREGEQSPWHTEPVASLTLAVDAQGNVLARAPAPYIAEGDRVLRFDVQKRKVRRQRCAQYVPSPEDAKLDRDIVASLIERSEAERLELLADPLREVDEAAFVDARTGRRHVVARMDSADVGSDFQFVSRLQASVGSLVFVNTWQWDYLCGAHGSGGSRAQVFNLLRETPEEVAIFDFVDQETSAAARVEAGRAFAKMRGEWGGETTEPTEAVALEPRYDDEGRLKTDVRFVTFAPYAFSTGWASYVMDAVGTLPTVPPIFAHEPPLPQVVRGVAKAEPRFVFRGYSALPAK